MKNDPSTIRELELHQDSLCLFTKWNRLWVASLLIGMVTISFLSSCFEAKPESSLKHIHISHQFADDIYVEPHLAIHPANDQIMAVASIVFDQSSEDQHKLGRIRIFISQNGGASWAESFTSPVISSHTGDPWIQITPTGQIVASALGGEHQTIVLYYSDDLGTSWQQKSLPKFGRRSYDHPTIQVIDNTYLITTSQGKGRHSEGYYGTSIIRLDKNFELIDTFWYDHAPFDMIAGNSISTDSSFVVPLSRLADYSDGYQKVLDHPKTDILHVSKSGSRRDTLLTIASHDAMGSFPVLLQDARDSNRLYVARHILENFGRTIYVWQSNDGGFNWNEIFSSKSLSNNNDCYNPQLAQGKNGTLFLTWHELDSNRCVNLVVMRKSPVNHTFVEKESVYDLPSCNQNAVHDSILFLGHRTVSDRFVVGGEYHGIAVKNEHQLCLVYTHSMTGKFQLYFTQGR